MLKDLEAPFDWPETALNSLIELLLKRNIRLNVSNAALRTVDYKGGLDSYLIEVKSFKLSPKAKKLKNQIESKS